VTGVDPVEATWWGIVNPYAGRGKDHLGRVHAALDDNGVDAELRASASAANVAELVAEGVKGGYRRFLAVGGDGTVNLVADALLRSDWPEPPVLGVLPAGSGCDLIRTFGISQSLEEAASHLPGTTTASLDAVHIRGLWGDRFFLNSAGAGLTGGVVEEVDRMPAGWGATRYQLGIWPALLKLPHANVEVVCGGSRFEGDALLIVMSNARFLGGGMKMAPHADPDDGLINVQVFHGPKRLALTLKPMVQRGKHLDHPNVMQMMGSDFSIRTDPDWPIEADGEYLGRGDIDGRVVTRAIELKI
jgi:diacylglycerol kinase (ATP)